MKHIEIEYRGTSGITQHCVEALASYLQECRQIGIAMLVSGPPDVHKCRSHAFLLTIDNVPQALILNGFASGYSGAGPKGLVTAIELLYSRGWDINEVQVDATVFERLCGAALTSVELEKLVASKGLPISYVFDYLPQRVKESPEMQESWKEVPINLPLPLFDQRIFDIAIKFWDDPDAALNNAYRRLEDVIRARSNLNSANDHGAKLFGRAFGNDKSPLVWRIHGDESTCFAPLFTGAFMGFRNKRAHREPGSESDQSVALELFQINTLFFLESQLVRREAEQPDAQGEHT